VAIFPILKEEMEVIFLQVVDGTRSQIIHFVLTRRVASGVPIVLLRRHLVNLMYAFAESPRRRGATPY
jgi:hypothetical protein